MEAARRVITRRTDWFLALAGDGPSRTWLLEEITKDPRLQERVHWLGPRDDIPGLLKQPTFSCSRRSGKECLTLSWRQWLPVAP